MRYFLQILSFLIAIPARADTSPFTGPGIVNTSGNYANQTSTVGAVANRTTADQLFQQALTDKAAGLSSFPPNIGLLSKALQEVQSGIQADNQSHVLAQAALNSVNTGDTAGSLNLNQYGAMSTDGMKKMVNSSSQYWPEVSSELGQFGLHMSENGQYMKTPIGTFPMNVDLGSVAQSASPAALIGMINAGAGRIAGLLGLSGSDISNGLQAGQARSQEIARNSLAQAQHAATQAGVQNVAKTNAESSRNPAAAKEPGAKPGLQLPVTTDGEKQYVDWNARAKKIAAFRLQLMKNLGIEAIHNKSDDLFQVVHARYQEIRLRGTFIDGAD